ncbi:hypothetical protein [Clostridium isatidis]|uniref:Uncharacterized protein n=1 Tax=Clostridium isatidis TaxID=182773 RepID=A0A343JAE1_9CLOT|nr:hypothetical protein [Clostridium isatidis]ASW42499.1 hypothetical protein BEN51_03095 [Clostridium isatidis]
MNNRFKTGLYIMSGILVLWIILNLAIKILVWLLPFILVLYLIFIIKRYIERKRNKYLNEMKYNSKDDDIDLIESNSNIIDDSITEVIEVEYTELDK